MIPLSIHKKILFNAITCVLCEPDDGSSFLRQYLQLKVVSNLRYGDKEFETALEDFQGTPCEAYQDIPTSLLYQEIIAWRDAMINGYNFHAGVATPIIRELKHRLKLWVEIADDEDHRQEDDDAISAAKNYLSSVNT